MFFRILKKDLQQKKGVNFILFAFMILATVFVASSVNNISVISKQTEYGMEKAIIGDLYIMQPGLGKETAFQKWMDESDLVTKYSTNESIELLKGNVKEFDGTNGEEFELKGKIYLAPEWKENMLVFDQNQDLLVLKSGEIAMQQAQMDENDLEPGDEITLTYGDWEKTMTVLEAIIDPAFGGDFIDTTRYLVSSEDFEEMKKQNTTILYNYNVYSEDIIQLQKDISKENFELGVTIDRDTFKMAYMVMKIAGTVLITVGVCLILIAFLILKFTIEFTMQQDYKEIGIMKAIGIRNSMIKRIYITKYIAMILVAAVIGCGLSFPLGEFLLKTLGGNVMLENATTHPELNILSSVVVAIVVVVLCYLCTNRVKRFSALESIRNGQTGERFERKTAFKLNKSKHVNPIIFMAGNDILSNVKKYLVLFFVFVIGTNVIIFPLNTISSLQSDNMATQFMLDVTKDFFVQTTADSDAEQAIITMKSYKKDLERFENKLAEKGYDIEADGMLLYNMSYYVEDKTECVSIMTVVPVCSKGEYTDVLEGSIPQNEKEVALSSKMMKELGVSIGDTIHYKDTDDDKELIIVGYYQNYMQLGKSAMLCEDYPIEDMVAVTSWYNQCKLTNREKFADLTDRELIDQLTNDFADMQFYTANDVVNLNLGNAMGILDNMKYIIVAVIFLVNMLISVLMTRIFIMGEKSQIAMLRSIGYSNHRVQQWQAIRIGMVIIVAVICGIGLSPLTNTFCLKPIFAFMGATNMKLTVNAMEVYVIYPLLLLLVNLLAAYISSGSVKKLNIMEISNAD